MLFVKIFAFHDSFTLFVSGLKPDTTKTYFTDGCLEILI
jgi:hypothetical protein